MSTIERCVVGSAAEMDRARRLRYYRVDSKPSDRYQSDNLVGNLAIFLELCALNGWPMIQSRLVVPGGRYRSNPAIEGCWSVCINVHKSMIEFVPSIRDAISKIFSSDIFVCNKQANIVFQIRCVRALSEYGVFEANATGLNEAQADSLSFLAFDAIMDIMEGNTSHAVRSAGPRSAVPGR